MAAKTLSGGGPEGCPMGGNRWSGYGATGVSDVLLCWLMLYLIIIHNTFAKDSKIVERVGMEMLLPLRNTWRQEGR